MRTLSIAVTIFILTSAFGISSVQAETFAVLVNTDNPFKGTATEAKQVIRRLYLKQQRDWPNGTDAVGFARPDSSEEELAFRKNVLNMNDAELAEHWLSLKQKRGETRPRAVGSTRILLRQLSNKKHAFGIVKKSEFTTFSSGSEKIRILFEFESSNDD